MVAVSVVIPTYERPDHLRGAIETALGQTVDDLAVIVVDDASATDYATAIADEYDRVRCVRHDENRGPAAARNTGIDAATGEYVAFLDDDDRWHEDKIERQAAVLSNRPDVGVVNCRTVAVDPAGAIVTCGGTPPSGDLADAILVDNVVGSPSRVLVRRAALEEHRFDESLPTKHDWDLFVRLCQEWPVAVVDDHLYVRLHHPSISSDPDVTRRDKRAVIEKHESKIRDRGLWDQAMAAYETRVGRKFLDQGDRGPARSHLRRAISHQPSGRRIALFALAYAPRSVFSAALDTKRGIESRWHDCPDASALRAAVPGYPSAASSR
jgi:glycosyltransferase involved in cell wall biosynthesis